MDFDKMNTCELVHFLTRKSIPKEICDLLEENDIDGSTLLSLTEDLNEFMAVLPKSGHRLKIKKLIMIAQLEEEASESPGHVKTAKLLPESEAKAQEQMLAWKQGSGTRLENSRWRPKVLTGKNPMLLWKIVDQPPLVASMRNSASNDSAASGSSVNNSHVGDDSCTEQATSIKWKNNSHVGDDSCTEQATSIKWKNNHTPSLPENLPFPSNFSLRVETAMKTGSVLLVRRQVIADIGSFYYGMTSHPKQGDYKRIALLVCKQFPELKDSNPSTYWITVQKQLSQYFRNQRRYSAGALSSKKESGETSKVRSSAAKRIKLFKDDPEAQKRNLELLRDAKPGAITQRTYNSLVDETFSERRNFVQKIAKSSTEVLQMCPYLGNRENLRKEMCRILPKDSSVGAAERLTAAFKAVLEKDEELETVDVVKAVGIIEKKTGKKRTTSIIKFEDPSTKVESLFKDKIVQFKVLCLGCPEEIQQVFIIGEDQAFLECQDTDITMALVDCISLYYVFDVSYPDGMKGILSFLQDVALQCGDNLYKGTKYATFLTELKNKLLN